MPQVEMREYSTTWPDDFKREAVLIQQALGANCVEIHHVGSTSIPGLCAKPIIDILPVVSNLAQVDLANEAMAALGYEPQGECGIFFRRHFTKTTADGVRTHNVNIFEIGSPEVARLLGFRDWIKNHPEDKEAYDALKRQLALQNPDNVLNYWIAKGPFIASIIEKMQYNGLRMVKALTPTEWQTAKRLCHGVDLERVELAESKSKSAENTKDIHVIFYQGAKQIGYAYLELEQRAIRCFVMDSDCAHLELEFEFRKMLDRWMLNLG